MKLKQFIEAMETKIDPKELPALKKAWDEHGQQTKFEDIDEFKCQRNYCIVRWKNKNGTVGLADLVRKGSDEPWEIQDDEFDEITEADWQKLKIVPDRHRFVIPGNPNFHSVMHVDLGN